VFGVISTETARRRKEIIGALALLLAHLMKSLLFGVAPHDPASFLTVAVVVVAVVAIATLVPAIPGDTIVSARRLARGVRLRRVVPLRRMARIRSGCSRADARQIAHEDANRRSSFISWRKACIGSWPVSRTAGC
jgi:hypothetical protein